MRPGTVPRARVCLPKLGERYRVARAHAHLCSACLEWWPHDMPTARPAMQRTTITLDDDLMARLDEFMADRQYANRSEAIRDLVRSGLEQAAIVAAPRSQCLAAAIYVYDHEERELSRRLTRSAHEHHDLSLATLHVHLDHDSCMEVTVLRGAVEEVQHFADHVIAERGVRHGRLVLVPVAEQTETHSHGETRAGPHRHLHVRRR